MNRAAESFAQGKLDDAYAWARGAILHNPAFASSYNTLGVIYQRHGNLAEAESALKYALERDPSNLHVMSNLASVLTAEGHVSEAQALALRLPVQKPNVTVPVIELFLK